MEIGQKVFLTHSGKIYPTHDILFKAFDFKNKTHNDCGVEFVGKLFEVINKNSKGDTYGIQRGDLQLVVDESGIKLSTTRKKKYSFVVELDEEETLSFSSVNEGFNAFEVLAFLEKKKYDILQQIAGDIQPEVISRKVIE